VRLTGGLVDTVIPFDGTNPGEANGFGFVAPDPGELYRATWTAMLNFKDAPAWKRLQQNGMRADFSWDRSAREYERVYHAALSSNA
jgi:starch synthase